LRAGLWGHSKGFASMRYISLAAALAAVGVLHAGAAQADQANLNLRGAGDQEIQDVRGQSVANRPRPGYDALGVRAGAFLLYPSITIVETYDDNIYAVNAGKTDDFITRVSPDVRLTSNWSRHMLSLQGGLDYYKYADNGDEDRTDWNVGAMGRVDILRDTNITGKVSYARLHEDRGDSTFIGGGAEPTQYDIFDTAITFNHRVNRLIFALGGGYTELDYKDTPAVGGGVINQDFRDRHVYSGVARAGYAISPDTNIYLQGRVNKREYRLQPPVVVQTRDSDGYSLVVGSEFLISRLVQGTVEIGYQRQNYKAAGLPTVSGLSYLAGVDWYVTPLTTVRFSASSSIDESDSLLSSGSLNQTVGLGFDHEFLRNLILSGDVSYQNNNFKGVARKDEYLRAGLGVTYMLNRYLALGVDYKYTERDSNVLGLDYKRNVVGLTLRGQL